MTRCTRTSRTRWPARARGAPRRARVGKLRGSAKKDWSSRAGPLGIRYSSPRRRWRSRPLSLFTGWFGTPPPPAYVAAPCR
ncbi:hypothetical protein B0H12DRAFT_1158725, partial [Mycena haematopus]